MMEPLPDYRIDAPEEPECEFDTMQAERERQGDAAYDQWVAEGEDKHELPRLRP